MRIKPYAFKDNDQGKIVDKPDCTDESVPHYVAFSPTGRQFAVVSRFGSVRLYDLQARYLPSPQTRSAFSPAKKITFNCPDHNLGSLSYSPNGRHLISGTKSGMIHIWNLRSDNSVIKLEATQTKYTRHRSRPAANGSSLAVRTRRFDSGAIDARQPTLVPSRVQGRFLVLRCSSPRVHSRCNLPCMESGSPYGSCHWLQGWVYSSLADFDQGRRREPIFPISLGQRQWTLIRTEYDS